MPARWINPYFVLLAGYLIGAAAYVSGLVGVIVVMAWASGFWSWQVGWSTWTALAYETWPCAIQLPPFLLLAAAAFAARSLSREQIVSAVVLLSTVVVGVANLAVLADWLTAEIVIANRLIDLHRARPGVVFNFLYAGVAVNAAHATGKILLVSLVLAVACIVTALVVRFARWLGTKHDGVTVSAE